MNCDAPGELVEEVDEVGSLGASRSSTTLSSSSSTEPNWTGTTGPTAASASRTWLCATDPRRRPGGRSSAISLTTAATSPCATSRTGGFVQTTQIARERVAPRRDDPVDEKPRLRRRFGDRPGVESLGGAGHAFSVRRRDDDFLARTLVVVVVVAAR